MKKIKCIIVDDEPVAQRILERYIHDLPEFELVATCLNALQAREVLQQQEVDLMFLDLEMPKLKGIAFLKTLVPSPPTIITTAYREFALAGYDLHVVDYLLKPITFERFIKAVNHFKQYYHASGSQAENPLPTNEIIDVKCDRKTVRLNKHDILFIEGMNNYIKIHTVDKNLVVYASLQSMVEKLGQNFIRIHKSFIVNKNKLTAFSNEAVELGDKILPVGLTYRKVLKEF